MCGICAIVSKNGMVDNHHETLALLIRRGPDGMGEAQFSSLNGFISGTILASVLCCRSEWCAQPVVHAQSGNILAWNGEIFGGLELNGRNDATVLSSILSGCSTEDDVIKVFLQVRGPYAFTYWHTALNTLYFGRDVLGRRSSVISVSNDSDALLLSSILPRCNGFLSNEELLPTGIFSLRLEDIDRVAFSKLTLYKYEWPSRIDSSRLPNSLNSLSSLFQEVVEIVVPNPLFQLSFDFTKLLPSEEADEKLKKIAALCPVEGDSIDPNSVTAILEQYLVEFPELGDLIYEFIDILKKSCECRCQNAPQSCLDCPIVDSSCVHCKIGVLFSGGLDSTILAALTDECLCSNTKSQVDLLNVAFFSKLPPSTSGPIPPDRSTALSVFDLLDKSSTHRKMNLVCIDISQEELHACRRERIRDLILPCDTILDDSLGCALWFATRKRDKGINASAYECPAKVLIHGLGADELFAGYSRHRASFQNGGWSAVLDSLLSDLAQLPHRNLGRDDRVASDNSRELRHPFLDENVVHFISSRVPIHLRFNPYLPRSIGDKLFLRFAATKLASATEENRWKDCLLKAAGFPKRAIQFGSRIANIEKESVRTNNPGSGRRINASRVSKKLLDD